jgi:phosphonate transport system ATP-binding protein
MNPDAAATIRDLSFRYRRDERDALAITALRIEAGQCVALIGTSGAGKSTLLRLLDGRLRGWSGEVNVLGHALDPVAPPPRRWRSKTGFVFQEFALVEQASVRQNVLNGRLGRTDPLWSLLGRFTDEDEEAAWRAMRDVGLEEVAERRADRLSGGQRQRVAIARCLAQDPGLILADEPVSNLDPVTSETVLGLLRDCAARRGAALIISSHQPRLAARFVGRFVALDHGRIVFDGAPDALGDEQFSGIYEAAARRTLVH